MTTPEIVLFSNYIKSSLIKDYQIMISNDVTSLYANMPRDMLRITKNHVNNDDQFIRKTAIPQENLLDLINLVLTTT